ncbi:lysylphosphatidylglycerol synthase transmembrane domain-containing protein [Dethiobacter alkaliphilus]|uniref:lysylphosphatidylglycerol synthase transmembrane domain-containing protein n=1 Tax=Dethiobacter alkaliphilus TaxID=427926 RepID=UPI002227CAAE|nr:flippase-like domain-containing protein [Dethiobacter alkaliphilus]MCW3488870.1 flippase-like domain-containing protein [Dethiobacter alkaliphilus]
MPNSMPVSKRGIFVSLALSVGSLALIMFFTVDEKTVESVLRLDPGFLVIATLMVTVLWGVEGLRIKAIAHSLGYTDPLPLRDGTRVYLVTFFFAGITPMAVGEWPAQVYGLCRSGLSAGESTAVSLVRAFLTKSVFVLAAAFLLFVDGRAAQGSGPIFILFRYAFWVMIATTAVYLLLMWRAGLAQSLLKRLQRLRHFQSFYEKKPKVRRFVDNLLNEANHFQDTVGYINKQNGLRFLVPMLLTVLFWGIFYSIAPVLLAGLGVAVDFHTTIAWQVMIMLVIPYVPIPGGSGVAEFGLATLFAAFVPASVLGVFILAWRFFTYYLTLIFGAIFMGGLGKKV